MAGKTYTFWARVIRVHDGDTLIVDLDQGLNEWHHDLSVRLAGVDAPELNDPRPDIAALAQQAKQTLLNLVSTVDLIQVTSVGWDKYVRIDATVMAGSNDVITLMSVAGLLRPYTGQGPKPW